MIVNIYKKIKFIKVKSITGESCIGVRPGLTSCEY